MPGDVILTSHLGFSPIKVANFCKVGYSKRFWTHSALYVGEGKLIESVCRGVRAIGLDEAYPEGKTGVRILRRRGLDGVDASRIVEYCRQQIGTRYDFQALAYFVFLHLLPSYLQFILTTDHWGRWLDRPGSYFCSELVSEGFKQAGVYCFEREPHQVMPVDFDNRLLFDEILTREIPTKKLNSRPRRWTLKTLYVLAIPFAIFLFIVFIIAAVIGIMWLVRFSQQKMFEQQKPPKSSPQPEDTTTHHVPEKTTPESVRREI